MRQGTVAAVAASRGGTFNRGALLCLPLPVSVGMYRAALQGPFVQLYVGSLPVSVGMYRTLLQGPFVLPGTGAQAFPTFPTPFTLLQL